MLKSRVTSLWRHARVDGRNGLLAEEEPSNRRYTGEEQDSPALTGISSQFRYNVLRGGGPFSSSVDGERFADRSWKGKIEGIRGFAINRMQTGKSICLLLIHRHEQRDFCRKLATILTVLSGRNYTPSSRVAIIIASPPLDPSFCACLLIS